MYAHKQQFAQALLESEERFRLAFHDAAIGMALVAPDGRWLKVNRSLCDIVGYSESELLQKSFQDITHLDDLNSDLGYMHQLLAGEIPNYQMEKRYIHKLGHIVWSLLTVSLVRDYQRQPLYFISQIQDITHRKQTEAQLQTFISELERSNRDLEEFAQAVSHDLLAPLGKIQMLNHLLEDEYGSLLDVKGREYLQRMKTVTTGMRTLIKDLLAFSRVTTQPQLLAPLNLNTIVQEVLLDLEPEIEKTRGSIQVGELPVLHADYVQMRQLFQNLISNGLKFHKPEVPPLVKIYQRYQSTQNEVSHHYGDLPYQIFVEDNGIGFNQAYRENIFAPFYRLHSHSRYEGTGMGLAICKKIVERHGGGITATSVPEQGATFIVTLPRTKF
jgi:PAS domain S-box-containing protein